MQVFLLHQCPKINFSSSDTRLCTVRIHQTFFKTLSALFSTFFLNLEAFESNTTSDWLNRTV